VIAALSTLNTRNAFRHRPLPAANVTHHFSFTGSFHHTLVLVYPLGGNHSEETPPNLNDIC
jgi:hypothetical protein